MNKNEESVLDYIVKYDICPVCMKPIPDDNEDTGCYFCSAPKVKKGG